MTSSCGEEDEGEEYLSMMRSNETRSHASSFASVRLPRIRGCFEAVDEVMNDDSGTDKSDSPAAMSLEAMR